MYVNQIHIELLALESVNNSVINNGIRLICFKNIIHSDFTR